MLRTSQGGVRYKAHTLAPAFWWFAAGILVLELVAALAGAGTLGLAAAALLAPGFALSGLLPGRLRASALARATLAPALGLAASSIALISVARLGVPLTAVSVRLVLVALVAAGLAVPRDPEAEPLPRPTLSFVLDLAVLAVILALATVLAWRVIGDLPVPGDDWAKYLLYADEIRKHSALLLTNELWMGGRPFSEDPGVPSLEGAALLMTGAPAGALVRTILVLTLIQLAAVFGATRAWFGLIPATIATTLLATIPATQNVLGWHGLANVGALAILALVLVQVGSWLAGDLDRRAEIGLALTVVAVVATHRFTALFMFGMLALSIGAALAFGSARDTRPVASSRKALFASVLRTGLLMVPIGLLVALDLRTRAADSGGTLPYTSYLPTKIDLTLAIRDVTPLLVAAAFISVVVLLMQRRLPRTVWPALAMTVICLLLAYGWVFHVPLYYSRVTFFAPLPLALLSAAGLGALLAGRKAARAPAAVAALAAVGALAFVFQGSWKQAEQVRQFYGFASPATLSGLDALSVHLKPGELVATDRCWSFLATWLLHTRTYPALEEQDIQPKAELIVARKAAAILHATDEGRELIRTLPVRYALLDPTCPVSGDRFTPPGTLVFASNRLAIVKLDPGAKTPKINVSPYARPKKKSKR